MGKRKTLGKEEEREEKVEELEEEEGLGGEGRGRGPKKKKIVSEKRAEQNRIAQRNFRCVPLSCTNLAIQSDLIWFCREKQLQKQRDMSLKMEMMEKLEQENQNIQLELNTIKVEKENLIHLMVGWFIYVKFSNVERRTSWDLKTCTCTTQRKPCEKSSTV